MQHRLFYFAFQLWELGKWMVELCPLHFEIHMFNFQSNFLNLPLRMIYFFSKAFRVVVIANIDEK